MKGRVWGGASMLAVAAMVGLASAGGASTQAVPSIAPVVARAGHFNRTGPEGRHRSCRVKCKPARVGRRGKPSRQAKRKRVLHGR